MESPLVQVPSVFYCCRGGESVVAHHMGNALFGMRDDLERLAENEVFSDEGLTIIKRLIGSTRRMSQVKLAIRTCPGCCETCRHEQGKRC